jgi:hypothetical protein
MLALPDIRTCGRDAEATREVLAVEDAQLGELHQLVALQPALGVDLAEDVGHLADLLGPGVRDRGDRVAERAHPRVGLADVEADGQERLGGRGDVLGLERRLGREVVEEPQLGARGRRGPEEPAHRDAVLLHRGVELDA